MTTGLRNLLLTLAFGLCIFRTSAQVTVTNPANTTPNLAASYTSLANAITALNGITAISGPVTISLAAGNPQTAPVGGYALTFSAATTATNNIVIEGNGNTITSNGGLTVNVFTDAIFKLIGVDYVTLQNFVMQENPSNVNTTPATNNMTEWGVALLHSSQTNGAQYNVIQNNTISLNRAYQNSFGIYSNARHSATAVSTANDISVGANVTGPNHGNKIYGNTISNVNVGISFVGSSSDGNMDVGNEIGGNTPATGNTITNWGSGAIANPTFLSSSGTIFGILVNHQKSEKISYNNITSANLTGATGAATRGIYKRYSNGLPSGVFTADINNNTITITNNLTVGITSFIGIDCVELSSASPSATFNINNNLLSNISIGATNTNFFGISTIAQVGVMNINDNIIRGTTMAGTGSFTGIYNTGAVITALNINNNKIGDNIAGAVTYSQQHSSVIAGINCPTVTNTAAVSISGNNFQGFTQTLAGTSLQEHKYISLVHAVAGATTDNINNNTFTNLVANTAGNVTFISRTGTMASLAGATDNCNNNSIVGSFSKPVSGGVVTIYTATTPSLTGNTMNQTGNNFSNITLTGATAMSGWNNIEGSTSSEGPVKNISNNIFSNWTCGSLAVVCMFINNAGSNSVVSGNTISNISATGSSAPTAITGISFGSSNRGTGISCSGNTLSGFNNSTTSTGAVLGISANWGSMTALTLSSNTISQLSSDAPVSIAGIRMSNGVLTPGAVINVSKNKIFDLTINNSSNSGTYTVSGIEITSTIIGTTYNISNNLVGDLKAPLSDGINVVRGINMNTATAPGTNTYNIYYNTVYLNASSAAANFGSSALFMIASGTTSAGTGVIRNNIFVNVSTPSGIGLTVAYRRNGALPGNFSTLSNNNIYYAGVPSASRLLYYDGTNSNQTLSAYKALVTPRDAGAYTELPPFLSTSGISPNFLHIDPAVPTQVESGAVNISGYTDDFDSNIRQGNTGYSGTGTAPDVGADEVEGIFTELNPPAITYTALTSLTCSYNNQTIGSVSITDVLGVPTSGANRPRVYYRKNSGSWYSQAGTLVSGNSKSGTWSFTIVVSDMGGVTGGDVVSYYIIAQDSAVTPNVGASPGTGLVATGVNSVTTHPTNPNTYGLNYVLSGTYTVGTGGNFSTLTAAINVYNNACNITSAVVFELIDNLYQSSETFPLTINNHAAASATNTLTIRPSATATPLISGAGNHLIVFNGARFIRIDGRQNGAGTTRSLTIVNTQATTLSTVRFVNDSKNDEVRYCTILGNSPNPTSGGTILFDAADPAGTGNDNHRIENNELRDGSATPAIAILSTGTATRENDNITISQNLVRDYFLASSRSCGIYISSGSNGWTINGNKFYQTASRVKTSGGLHYGILINTGSGYNISNNVIGYASENGTGRTSIMGASADIVGFPASYSLPASTKTLAFVGISCGFTAGASSLISSNTIAAMDMFTDNGNTGTYGIWTGIYQESGNADIKDNIIGSTTGSGSIYVATTGNLGQVNGIRAVSSGYTSISGNQIGGILASGTSATISPALTGISFGGTGSFDVYNNTIGNNTAFNLKQGYLFDGSNLSSSGTNTAVNSTAAFTGINSTVTGTAVRISNNTLQGWETATTSGNITGIGCSGIMIGLNPVVSVDSNSIGTSSAGLIRYVSASAGTFSFISQSVFLATKQNMRHNDMRGVTYSSALPNTGSHYLIYLVNASAANNQSVIRANTFTNLNLSVNNNLNFIYHSYTQASSGSLIIDSNRIVGAFNAPYPGAFSTSLTQTNATASGGEFVFANNNFSNITTANQNGLNGVYNLDALKKSIYGNVTDNWNSPGNITVYNTGNTSQANARISSNSISQITSSSAAGTINAIYHINNNGNNFLIDSNHITQLAADNVYGIQLQGNSTQPVSIRYNDIHSLNSSGTGFSVRPVRINSTGASSVTVSYNKIYDITCTEALAYAGGISLFTNSTVNILNNLIGDIKAPNSNLGATAPTIAGIREEGGVSSPGINIYYNSIHLASSGSGANFSSAGLYIFTFSALRLRNNILNNESVPGALGRSVAFWYGGTNISNYQSVSNNNLLFAGSPGPQNLIFFDGNNSDQTLGAFKARVTPREDKSVSVQTQFISTNGADATFLHLSSGNNCQLLGGGDNTGILLSTDYDQEPRNISFPFITDIGADEAGKFTAWTGANGTNWNDPANWSNGIVPNSTEVNVSITEPPVNQPVIGLGETFQVGTLYISPEATLYNRGTLKVYGRQIATLECIDNTQAGIVRGSMEYNGDCDAVQSISGSVFKNNVVRNLTVSNDLDIDANTGEEVKVAETLSFGPVTGKTLSTGDNLVLLSTATQTARVADITGNSISGKATVERFINTGVTTGAHAKSWQFLAAPTIGQSIYNAGRNPATIRRAWNLDNGHDGTGFDASSALPALKYYESRN
ncbi:MAG: hypothetical protein U0T56_07345 [Ferruginibacter sp.]